MEIRPADPVPEADERRPTFLSGFAVGLFVNLVIFVLVYGTPGAERYIPVWLALGVLYAGPAVVGIAGLTLFSAPQTRRRGVGLILSAPLTVAAWFVFFYVDTLVAVSGNTAGG